MVHTMQDPDYRRIEQKTSQLCRTMITEEEESTIPGTQLYRTDYRRREHNSRYTAI